MSELNELEVHEIRERVAALFRYAQVGLCVNSVTHDINNYLGAILAYAELIDMGESLDAEGHRMLQEIIEGVRRCTSVLTALTVAARPDKPAVAVVDPARLLAQVVELRAHDVRFQRIDLDQQVGPAMPSLIADHAKLELALLYLVTNACEAVAHASPKTIRLRVDCVDEVFTFTVWNSGPPLPQTCWDSIFEPFTTSKNGSHLGLGLAMAREIARIHDGNLTYAPDRGFVLTIPRANRFAKEMA